MKINAFIIALLLISGMAQSQDFADYYSYNLNPVNVNPAMVGNGSRIEGLLNSRTMYQSIEGAPRNIMFALHSPLMDNQGVGVRMISDRRGVFEVSRFDGAFSHRLMFDDKTFVRLGMSAGMISRNINTSDLAKKSSFVSMDDPTMYATEFNSVNFTSGFGVYAEIDRLHLGFSAPQIIERARPLNGHLTGMLGYRYSASDKIDIYPWVLAQHLPGGRYLADVNCRFTLNKIVYTQLAYATSSKVKGAFGFDLKGFGMAYMYEHSLGNVANLAPSTHEVQFNLYIERPSTSKVAGKLDEIVERLDDLIYSDYYDREFLLNEIEKINARLIEMKIKNNSRTAPVIQQRLITVEERINVLIEKVKKLNK